MGAVDKGSARMNGRFCFNCISIETGVSGFIPALFVNMGGIESCDFGLKKAWGASLFSK
jgi:hypothetical protein